MTKSSGKLNEKLVIRAIAFISKPVFNFIIHIRKWLNTEITNGLIYRMHGYPIIRKEGLKRNGEIILIIIVVIFFTWLAVTSDKPLPLG